MVTRPSKLFKTPPSSRGTSPARSTTSRKASPSQGISRKARSFELAAGNRKAQSPNRQQTQTPERPSFMRSVGSSPSRSFSDELPRSRGSDSGSIERLDDYNNLQRIITSYNETEDNINVVVRVRPLNQRELRSADANVLQFPGHGQILVDGIPGGPSGGQNPKLFSYNVVFEAAATQEDVLQFSGMKRLIEMAIEGFRCTCFCYGQTGSGKTHTLTGPPLLFGVKPAPFSDNHGLIFRSFLYLFKLIHEKPEVHFILKASYLEIYNEKVIDLLNPGSARKPLSVRWSKKARGFFVENLFTVDCEELDDLIAVLEEGLRNRSVGKHNMNDFSSRSHTILTVYITSEQPAENGVFLSRSGKINFVDLAGSEMTKKTQSEGKTLIEANNINKSLMVLGYCISSLSDTKRKHSHIPYRDSKLTKLLADSLAGNGVTLMIACISPAKSNISETLNTLRYAARAKKIRTKPIVLMDPREALILTLKREVNVLQSENEHLRSALNVHSGSRGAGADLLQAEKRIITTPPDVNLEKLAELEGPQLAELVRLYINENETLRNENTELFTSREMLQRDHQVVCHENERLLKKLEEVNSVNSMSPLISGRPIFSAEVFNTEHDSGNNVITSEGRTKNIPEVIRKELDKRQIKTGIQEPRREHHLNRSLDENHVNEKAVNVKSSNGAETPIRGRSLGDSNLSNDESKATGRRFSISRQLSQEVSKSTKHNQLENTHVFGSIISVTSDEES